MGSKTLPVWLWGVEDKSCSGRPSDCSTLARASTLAVLLYMPRTRWSSVRKPTCTTPRRVAQVLELSSVSSLLLSLESNSSALESNSRVLLRSMRCKSHNSPRGLSRELGCKIREVVH